MSSGAYGGGWWDGRRAIDAYQPVVPPTGSSTASTSRPAASPAVTHAGHRLRDRRSAAGPRIGPAAAERAPQGRQRRPGAARAGQAVGGLGRGPRPGQRRDHDQDGAVGRHGLLGRDDRLAAGAGRPGGQPDHRERGRRAGEQVPADPRPGLRRGRATSARARWSARARTCAGTSTAASRSRSACVTCSGSVTGGRVLEDDGPRSRPRRATRTSG